MPKNGRRKGRPFLGEAEFKRRVGELLDDLAIRVIENFPASSNVTSPRHRSIARGAQRTSSPKRTLNEWIALAVLDALEQNNWNKSLAANQLGIHRSRIRRLIVQFSLKPATSRPSG